MTDREILQALADGDIEISGFCRDRLQGVSYDCELGDYVWRKSTGIVAPRQQLKAPITLQRGKLLLAHTHEFIRCGSSVTFTVHTTSTARRHGIDVCGSAGWGDPGFCNRVTLEIMYDGWHDKLELPDRAILAQIAFHRLSGPVLRPYRGRYGSAQYVDYAAATWRPEMMLPREIKGQGV